MSIEAERKRAEAMDADVDQARLEVLASTVGAGGHVGAPATRDEERAMARELLELRREFDQATEQVQRIGRACDGATERAERAEAAISRIAEWTHVFGSALVPSGADTYGEGVRACKAQVASLLGKASDGSRDETSNALRSDDRMRAHNPPTTDAARAAGVGAPSSAAGITSLADRGSEESASFGTDEQRWWLALEDADDPAPFAFRTEADAVDEAGEHGIVVGPLIAVSAAAITTAPACEQHAREHAFVTGPTCVLCGGADPPPTGLVYSPTRGREPCHKTCHAAVERERRRVMEDSGPPHLPSLKAVVGEARAVLAAYVELHALRQKTDGQRVHLARRDAEIIRFAKWVLDHRRDARDHACARCVPGGPILVEGFVCVPHRAEAFVARGSVDVSARTVLAEGTSE